MSTPNSSVNIAPFEQAASGDINRLQKLASREQQDYVKDASTTDETRNRTTGAFVAPTSVSSGGDQVSEGLALPYLAPTTVLNMQLGAGQGYLETTPPATADDSTHNVVRWPITNLSFSGGGANPRVDLVVATPASVGTDFVSRNILLDPVTRTVAAQSIAKTINPLATIAIVVGAEAANPIPPAVPAGALALFEVYVPAGAAASSAFSVMRRMNRHTTYPLSSYHGILQGCVPQWTIVNETTTSADINLLATAVHRAVIDGEVLTFKGTVPNAVDDAANAPGTAPANSDKPFYIYLVGGRTVVTNIQRQAGGCPFLLIKSASAPDEYGRPSVALTVPGGASVRNGALYIGIGFVVKNTTRVKSCAIVGDYVRALISLGFNEAARTTSPAGVVATLATRPAPSTLVKLKALISALSVGQTFAIDINSAAISLPDVYAVSVVGTDSGSTYQAGVDLPLVVAAPELKIFHTGSASTDVFAVAYNMNVPRLSP